MSIRVMARNFPKYKMPSCVDSMNCWLLNNLLICTIIEKINRQLTTILEYNYYLGNLGN
jgi:hypothetical protein